MAELLKTAWLKIAVICSLSHTSSSPVHRVTLATLTWEPSFMLGGNGLWLLCMHWPQVCSMWGNSEAQVERKTPPRAKTDSQMPYCTSIVQTLICIPFVSISVAKASHVATQHNGRKAHFCEGEDSSKCL